MFNDHDRSVLLHQFDNFYACRYDIIKLPMIKQRNHTHIKLKKKSNLPSVYCLIYIKLQVMNKFYVVKIFIFIRSRSKNEISFGLRVPFSTAGSAVASNRPTEALASVISFTFVVYSHYKHS